jgi:hypothetical protein
MRDKDDRVDNDEEDGDDSSGNFTFRLALFLILVISLGPVFGLGQLTPLAIGAGIVWLAWPDNDRPSNPPS